MILFSGIVTQPGRLARHVVKNCRTLVLKCPCAGRPMSIYCTNNEVIINGLDEVTIASDSGEIVVEYFSRDQICLVFHSVEAI